jgi:hypothetical protein
VVHRPGPGRRAAGVADRRRTVVVPGAEPLPGKRGVPGSSQPQAGPRPSPSGRAGSGTSTPPVTPTTSPTSPESAPWPVGGPSSGQMLSGHGGKNSPTSPGVPTTTSPANRTASTTRSPNAASGARRTPPPQTGPGTSTVPPKSRGACPGSRKCSRASTTSETEQPAFGERFSARTPTHAQKGRTAQIIRYRAHAHARSPGVEADHIGGSSAPLPRSPLPSVRETGHRGQPSQRPAEQAVVSLASHQRARVLTNWWQRFARCNLT